MENQTPLLLAKGDETKKIPHDNASIEDTDQPVPRQTEQIDPSLH